MKWWKEIVCVLLMIIAILAYIGHQWNERDDRYDEGYTEGMSYYKESYLRQLGAIRGLITDGCPETPSLTYYLSLGTFPQIPKIECRKVLDHSCNCQDPDDNRVYYISQTINLGMNGDMLAPNYPVCRYKWVCEEVTD